MSYILLYFSIEFISKIRNNQHLLSQNLHDLQSESRIMSNLLNLASTNLRLKMNYQKL